MNCDNDPNLTAYALGELTEDQKIKVEKLLETSPEAQHFVAETRALAGLLQKEFTAELNKPGRQSNIMRLSPPKNLWWDSQWMSIRIAALLAIAAVVAIIVVWTVKLNGNYFKSTRARSEVTGPEHGVVMELPPQKTVEGEALEEGSGVGAREASAELARSDFITTAIVPVSTFGLAIDTSAYDQIRTLINAGKRPAREAIRIRGMINYFQYAYPVPTDGSPLSINIEVTTCPWNVDHHLVRIGLKCRDSGSGIVAEDVKVEVRFSASSIESYRLLGSDDRAQAPNGRSAPAGEKMRSGQSVTALYEIIPVANQRVLSGSNLVRVIARYRRTGMEQTEVAEAARPSLGGKLDDASADLRFAAAVAQFGLILRGDITSDAMDAVINEAERARTPTSSTARAEFVQLARKARELFF